MQLVWLCGAVFLGFPGAVSKGPCREPAQSHIPGTPHTKPFADPALTGLQPRGGGG